ncbi:hypothetical protein H0H93_004843 [Arthromyces matolae]|nr:hypothetical protein H0H93_004843 [Arthromyces matolae]
MGGLDLSDEYVQKERLECDYYELLTDNIRNLGKSCLAEVTYNVDFKRIIETYSGNYTYVTATGGPFTINVFGQIAPVSAGTMISAKGNHYMGRDDEKTKPICDDSRVKDILTLCQPTGCSTTLANLFLNQIGTLNEIKEADEFEELSSTKIFKTKDWVKGYGDDRYSEKNMFSVHMGKKYGNPNKKASGGGQRLKKRPLHEVAASDDDSTASSNDTMPGSSSDGPVVKMGAFYDPRLNEDYRGELFQLVDDKLVQLDVRTTEGTLIPPWKFYDALKPGTLILAECTLHVFMLEDVKKGLTRKTYQINARSIRILDGSDADPIARIIPELRKPNSESTSDGPTFKSDVSNAFASFEIPNKKRKTNESAAVKSASGSGAKKGPGANNKTAADKRKNRKKKQVVGEDEDDFGMVTSAADKNKDKEKEGSVDEREDDVDMEM